MQANSLANIYLLRVGSGVDLVRAVFVVINHRLAPVACFFFRSILSSPLLPGNVAVATTRWQVPGVSPFPVSFVWRRQ